MFYSDPDPAFHLDSDPDPAFHFDSIRIRSWILLYKFIKKEHWHCFHFIVLAVPLFFYNAFYKILTSWTYVEELKKLLINFLIFIYFIRYKIGFNPIKIFRIRIMQNERVRHTASSNTTFTWRLGRVKKKCEFKGRTRLENNSKDDKTLPILIITVAIFVFPNSLQHLFVLGLWVYYCPCSFLVEKGALLFKNIVFITSSKHL